MTAHRQAPKVEHVGKGFYSVGAYSTPRLCEDVAVRPDAMDLCCRLARCADITRERDAGGKDDGAATDPSTGK